MKTVRDGRKVAPYCSECGCRLWVGKYETKRVIMEHFQEAFDDVDARGHDCSLLYEHWIDFEHNIYVRV